MFNRVAELFQPDDEVKPMKYVLASILFLFLMAGLWSINASTPSFILTGFHYGTEGGRFNTTSFNGSETLTAMQAGTKNASTFHFSFNYGWFNISINAPAFVGEFFNISIFYPYTGSTLGMMDSNCHLIICSNISGTNATTINSNITVYSGNGSGSFALLHTYHTNNITNCINTTIPANFANSSLIINGTAQTLATINYSNNVSVSIYGTTFCTGGTNAKKAGGNDWLRLVGLIIILIGMGIALYVMFWQKVG